MRVSCVVGHRWVVAAGRCAGCGCQLLGCGPIDVDEPVLVWLAAPYSHVPAARLCRARTSERVRRPTKRDGERRGERSERHVVAHAVGVCADCGCQVEALGDPSVGREVWVL